MESSAGNPVEHELDALFARFIVEAEVNIAAPPENVWEVVADPQRMASFSPECIKVEWLGDVSGPVVGARFAGTNRTTRDRLPPDRRDGLPADWSLEWTLPCEIVDAVPGRLFRYVVGDRFDGTPSTEWTYELEPSNGGTLLRERMRHLAAGRSANRTRADEHPELASQIIEHRAALLRADFEKTLAAVRAAIERNIADDKS